MKSFWKAGGQVESKTTSAAARPDDSPKVQAVVTKKAVRKLSCWGGSGTAGEAEGVSSPSVSPASDRIKATSGAVVSDSHQHQVCPFSSSLCFIAYASRACKLLFISSYAMAIVLLGQNIQVSPVNTACIVAARRQPQGVRIPMGRHDEGQLHYKHCNSAQSGDL